MKKFCECLTEPAINIINFRKKNEVISEGAAGIK